MVFTLIGTTQWTLDTLLDLTFPLLKRLTAGSGQILYPRLKPELDAQFAQISDDPVKKGEESPIDKIIREHNERKAALATGEQPQLTPKQRKRQEAYRILYGHYLGEESPEKQAQEGRIIPNLPKETAQAILVFAQEGRFPDELWARDVAWRWLDIQATAGQ